MSDFDNAVREKYNELYLRSVQSHTELVEEMHKKGWFDRKPRSEGMKKTTADGKGSATVGSGEFVEVIGKQRKETQEGPFTYFNVRSCDITRNLWLPDLVGLKVVKHSHTSLYYAIMRDGEEVLLSLPDAELLSTTLSIAMPVLPVTAYRSRAGTVLVYHDGSIEIQMGENVANAVVMKPDHVVFLQVPGSGDKSTAILGGTCTDGKYRNVYILPEYVDVVRSALLVHGGTPRYDQWFFTTVPSTSASTMLRISAVRSMIATSMMRDVEVGPGKKLFTLSVGDFDKLYTVWMKFCDNPRAAT